MLSPPSFEDAGMKEAEIITSVRHDEREGPGGGEMSGGGRSLV